jgi:hypothetical protein
LFEAGRSFEQRREVPRPKRNRERSEKPNPAGRRSERGSERTPFARGKPDEGLPDVRRATQRTESARSARPPHSGRATRQLEELR